MKLSRFVAKLDWLGRTAAAGMIAAGRVRVNGAVVRDGFYEVDRFTSVEVDGKTVQVGANAVYLMVNKPAGILSATSDLEYRTVVDLLDHPQKEELHLVGRLDRASTGLVLLTNDGRWSKLLMHPERNVPKVYEVETKEVIPAEAVEAFARGFYFHTEDITTLPAELELLGPNQARVTLVEGRYHQIKRMFHRVGAQVRSLHRASIGPWRLPEDMAPGQWREVSPEWHQLEGGNDVVNRVNPAYT
ncbi:MAG: rRNA pseudouridine synthase [Verrucomicrobiaceae bacterium]|nr:rRNA pseudouridine synthase [Verrucomicrobiaceae bacterium]